jgi:hypothetical protein
MPLRLVMLVVIYLGSGKLILLIVILIIEYDQTVRLAVLLIERCWHLLRRCSWHLCRAVEFSCILQTRVHIQTYIPVPYTTHVHQPLAR